MDILLTIWKVMESGSQEIGKCKKQPITTKSFWPTFCVKILEFVFSKQCPIGYYPEKNLLTIYFILEVT